MFSIGFIIVFIVFVFFGFFGSCWNISSFMRVKGRSYFGRRKGCLLLMGI